MFVKGDFYGRRSVMGKITSDFERFLYANYPDDYRRATAEDVADDVITAILSKHHFHYDVWKDIPEWIRAEYRDDIPVEVLNGNIRVEAFIYEEYDKLTYDERDKAKEEEERQAREEAFVANLSIAFLAAGYTAGAVSRLAENHRERNELIKQMAIHGRTPELVAAYFATRESDIRTISDEYDRNEKLVHKKVLHLAKKLNRMKRCKDGHDEEEYKKAEEKLKRVMAYVSSNPEAREKLEKHLDDPVARSALRHLVPEVKDMFSSLMDKAGLLAAMQQAMEEDRRAKTSAKSSKSVEDVRADNVDVSKSRSETVSNHMQIVEENVAKTPVKSILRYSKVLSRMQKSPNGYDKKEYAALEDKLREAIAAVSQDDELKKGIVEYLRKPSSQGALYQLTEDIRGQLMTSMKDIGVLIVPRGENVKGFEINRDTLSEGLMKDFVESNKLGKILTNKLGYKSEEFVKEETKTNSKDKSSNLVVMSKGDRASMT